jgi:hypothetical protein
MPLNENAISQILPFAPEGVEAAGDLFTLAEYEESILRVRGHQPGIAERGVQNRANRQAAYIAAGIAQFIANRYGPGVVDDGDLDAVEAGMAAAITSLMPNYDEELWEHAFLRKLSIGAPKNHRSTILPPKHAWVNGDFIPFADWPEFAEVYNDGGFAGMLLDYNATPDTIAANLGKYRPDAANPTGLYLPSLGDQFLRAWVSGLARAAGSWQADAMRTHMHNVTYRGTDSRAGNYILMGDNVGAQPQTKNMGGPVDFAGNDLLTADHTRPPNISQPFIIYLGIPA